MDAVYAVVETKIDENEPGCSPVTVGIFRTEEAARAQADKDNESEDRLACGNVQYEYSVEKFMVRG